MPDKSFLKDFLPGSRKSAPEEEAAPLEEIDAPNISVFFLMMLCLSVVCVAVFFIRVEAIVSGTGVVEAGRGLQSIKSQEGGILEKIFVKEGQEVVAGQELALLSNSTILAKRLDVEGELASLKTKVFRLQQEKTGKDRLVWPDDMQGALDSDMLRVQADLFHARKNRYQSELEAIQYEISGLEKELAGARAELVALNDEIAAVQKILEFRREGRASGFVGKADVLQSESQYAQITRERTKIQSRIPALQSQIDEARKRYHEQQSQQQQAILSEEEEVIAKIRSLETETSSVADKDDRRILRSPMAAVVNNIHVRGVGDVISPAEPIIDIVPLDQGLVIKAKIDPSLRRGLYQGLPAKVSFTALQDLRVVPLEGTLNFVAADTQTNQDGQTFYEIHVVTKEDSVVLPGGGSMRIEPGMQASVNIVVGEHSVADFLLSPLEWVMDNAFRQR